MKKKRVIKKGGFLRLYKISKMSPGLREQIADWLRKKSQEVLEHPHKLSDTFTSTFFY